MGEDRRVRTEFLEALDGKRLGAIRQKVAAVSVTPALPPRPAREHSPATSRPPRTTRQPSGPGESMPPGEKAVLTAAAQWAEGVTRDQLGVLTGYKRSSRDAYIARLAQKGWVASPNGHVVATEAGVAALGADFTPLPTGDALYQWWLPRLPEGERKVLQILVDAGGKPVSRESIDEATGYRRSSRDAYLSRLGARKLVASVGRGEVQASGELFG